MSTEDGTVLNSTNDETYTMAVNEKPNTVRVAVTQAEPEWLDLAKGVQKTCHLIEEAARNGAQIVTFPECWIVGYPAWIWSRPVDIDLHVRYMKNSLRRHSPEMDAIRACAAKHKIIVVLGFSENDHDSLYISQSVIGPDGVDKMFRRKLKPTHMERTIFGDASGDSLKNVVDTDVGRVGALACWEHTQPLLKYHTMLQREQIHVAAWPPVYKHSGGGELWSMSAEGCQTLARNYAIESQTFVLHCTAVMSQGGVDMMDTSGGVACNSAGGGSSAIFGPDGRRLSKDIPPTEEGIIYADLELNAILQAKSFLDPCGHYSRPDMLFLGVDEKEKKHLRTDVSLK